MARAQTLTERRARERGYDDGYALRPARAFGAIYQRAWREGRAARRRDDAAQGAER